MNPIALNLNDSIAPDYGIAVAAHYRFYVSWTWWDEGTISPEKRTRDMVYRDVMTPPRQRFGGALLTTSSPAFDVLAVLESLKAQVGHDVTILFWKEQ